MKIAVMLFRPWSAVCRYRSLIVNAKRLGHELLCIGSKPGSGNTEFTAAILKEMGVALRPAKETEQALIDFNPDVIFGEALNDSFEYLAQQWAAKCNKIGLVLDHAQFIRSALTTWILKTMKELPKSTIMVANESRKAECKAVGIPVKRVGVPDLDLIQDQYDIQMIRKRLGLKDEILIAFFPDMYWLDRKEIQKTEKEALFPFFQLTNAEGWKVFIHPHGGERRMPNSLGPEGLSWGQPRYDYFKWLQDQGARFVVDFLPGKIGELEFLPCSPYELMAAANCVFGSSPNLHWKVAALKRWYFYLAIPEQLEHRIINPTILPYLNVILTLSPFAAIQEAVKNPKPFELKPALIQEWFYGLDKQCWRRMLDLAEGLQ